MVFIKMSKIVHHTSSVGIKENMVIKCTALPELFFIPAFWNALGHIACPVITNVTNHVDHHVPDGHQRRSENSVLTHMM